MAERPELTAATTIRDIVVCYPELIAPLARRGVYCFS